MKNSHIPKSKQFKKKITIFIKKLLSMGAASLITCISANAANIPLWQIDKITELTIQQHNEHNAAVQKKIEVIKQLEKQNSSINELIPLYIDITNTLMKDRSYPETEQLLESILIRTPKNEEYIETYCGLAGNLALSYLKTGNIEKLDLLVKNTKTIITKFKKEDDIQGISFSIIEAQLELLKGNKSEFYIKLEAAENKTSALYAHNNEQYKSLVDSIGSAYGLAADYRNMIKILRDASALHEEKIKSQATERERIFIHWSVKMLEANLLIMSSNYEESDEIITSALKIDDLYPEVKSQFLQYKAYQEAFYGNTSAAIRLYTQSAEMCRRINPTCTLNALTQLAKLSLTKNRLDETKKTLGQMEEILSTANYFDANTIYNFAVICYEVGDFKKAEAYNKLTTAITSSREKNISGINNNLSLAISLKNTDMENAKKYESAIFQEVIRPDAPYIINLSKRLRNTDSKIIEAVDLYYDLYKKSETYFNNSFIYAQATTPSNTEEAITSAAIRSSAPSERLKSLLISKQAILARIGNAYIQNSEHATADNYIDDLKKISQEVLKEGGEKYSYTMTSPLSVEQTRTSLKNEQALVMYRPGLRNYYAWVITKTASKLLRLDTNEKEVRSLSKSILSSLELADNGKLSAYATDSALTLYRKIFKPVEEHLNGVRHIYLATNGSLLSIPFSALTTSAKQGDWLAKKYSFSLLPSPTALLMLNKNAKTQSTLPFLGFGDPLLQGKPENQKTPITRSAVYKDGTPSAARISQLAPLPETREELIQMSKSLGGSDEYLYFGERATKSHLKKLPTDKFKTMAFATHGLIAGEAGAEYDSGLILTPNIDNNDDGLLSISDIMDIRLDAEWVILSACSTAIGQENINHEGLSNLVNGFFFSGAKSLLVSNWKVDSNSAAKITTKTIQLATTNKMISKSEALRLAMLEMANTREKEHPFFWAPFIIIGSIEAHSGNQP